MSFEVSPTSTGATSGKRQKIGIPAIPKPGAVVEVRGSAWAVTDVREQGLSRSPAYETAAVRQHCVTLQSLAEDRMGEELRVVWELEVGQTVLPEQGLPEVVSPEAFDDPNTLGAFVDAMRWGAVTNADDNAFQSPFRTGARLEPYQLEPLRRALASSRANLLLADDVGLGKTIEAGLVIEELLLRHRARTVVIVCPPSLCIKWRDEMLEKFGLEFQIVNSQTVAEARRSYGLGSNPFILFPRTIVSMEWVAMPRAQRLLAEVYAKDSASHSALSYTFDVLVVDEAHHVAPAAPTAMGGARGYAVDSKRTIAVRELANHCEHRLFLSATPHNGYSESFTALLEMIDPRRFTRGARLDADALKDVTVRRLKTNIKSRDFKPRRIEQIEFTPDESEERQYSLLVELLKESAHNKQGNNTLGIAALLLQKRFLSSPWAFSCTLGNYLDAPKNEFVWSDDDYYTEVMGSGQSDEEEGRPQQPEFETLSNAKSDRPLGAATDEQIKGLVDWGSAYESRPNGRLKALLAWLDGICRPQGAWGSERVVVFTEYADTLDWFERVLRSKGYGDDRMASIQGSTPPEERELIRARFNADPSDEPLRVLIATDAAGEGIDLQAWCHRLVNLDVPFNPARLEQRIGRIDRYGQTQTPEVYYFQPARNSGSFEGQLDFMGRIVKKVAVADRELGAMNPLVDDEIYSHFTGQERNRARSRAQAHADDAINRALAGDVELNAQLTRLGQGYEANKEALHISPSSECRVVDVALGLTNQPSLATVPGREGVFRLPQLNGSWEHVSRGFDTVLDPGKPRPFTFDRELVEKDPGLVYVHLGSPLLSKAARTLRANLYGDGSLNRVTAVVVPRIDQTCAAAVARLVLVGRGGMRVHEEVFVTGIRFRGANMAEEKVQRLLDGALDVGDLSLASPAVRGRLASEWDASRGRLRSRLEEEVRRRADVRKTAVEGSLEDRKQAELDRVRGVYRAFKENLQASLDQLREEDQEQLSFDFSTDEQRRQRERDVKHIERRLDDVDDEAERELEAVRERYRDVRPYLTIAALVFAVSPQDVAEWEARR